MNYITTYSSPTVKRKPTLCSACSRKVIQIVKNVLCKLAALAGSYTIADRNYNEKLLDKPLGVLPNMSQSKTCIYNHVCNNSSPDCMRSRPEQLTLDSGCAKILISNDELCSIYNFFSIFIFLKLFLTSILK